METEKLLIVAFVGILAIVGLVIGATFLTFTPTGVDDNGSSTDDIVFDTDLIDLELEAPDWSLILSDESTIALSDFEGEFLLVDLMASWCSACETENDYLEVIHDDYSNSLQIISLSVDSGDTASAMAEYKSERDLPWLFGLDTESVFSDYFDIRYIPTLVIIDDNGYFRWVHEGLWTDSEIAEVLAELM